MRQFDPNKLMVHIEDAKAWLNQASDEYRQANPARGELILNIAQAEVKHAWELSHQQFVTKEEVSLKARRPNRIWLAAAAVMVVALLLVAGIPLGTMIAKHNSAPQPKIAQQPAIQPETSIVANPVIPAIPDPVKVPANKVIAVKPVVNNNQPVTTPEERQPAPAVAVTTNTNHTERNSDQPVTPRTQPAARITIDEDDLAKEASRTLRSGK